MTETNIEALQRIIAEQKEEIRALTASRRQAYDKLDMIRKASDSFHDNISNLCTLTQSFKVVLSLYKPVDAEIRR